MSKYRIQHAAVLAALLLVLTGCRGSFERASGDETVSPRPLAKDDYPLALEEDFTVVPAEYPLYAQVDTALLADSVIVGPQDIDTTQAERKRYESYRIQLYTSKIYGPAVRERNIAREVFDQQTWLDYEVPYYKVRVGDFPDRGTAEAYLPAVKEAGYPTAWVVKVNLGIWTLNGMYDDEDIAPLIDSAVTNSVELLEPVDDSTEYRDD